MKTIILARKFKIIFQHAFSKGHHYRDRIFACITFACGTSACPFTLWPNACWTKACCDHCLRSHLLAVFFACEQYACGCYLLVRHLLVAPPYYFKRLKKVLIFACVCIRNTDIKALPFTDCKMESPRTYIFIKWAWVRMKIFPGGEHGP